MDNKQVINMTIKFIYFIKLYWVFVKNSQRKNI